MLLKLSLSQRESNNIRHELRRNLKFHFATLEKSPADLYFDDDWSLSKKFKRFCHSCKYQTYRHNLTYVFKRDSFVPKKLI